MWIILTTSRCVTEKRIRIVFFMQNEFFLVFSFPLKLALIIKSKHNKKASSLSNHGNIRFKS